MKIINTGIKDVKLIYPMKHEDTRGFFSESYNKQKLIESDIKINFIQDNHSLSIEKGVIRGLHYQTEPFAQDKLVRAISGSIFDVAVDLRKNSKTFGKHVSAIISSSDYNQILVPKGFAHGFCTLENNTEIIYKVSNYYSPQCDQGILWNDPSLNIKWPIIPKDAILSDKDKNQPLLSEIKNFF